MTANGHTNGDYAAFLASKAQIADAAGFEPLWLPDWLFDFQKALVEWAIRKGRAALFEDCGLGKTPQQLVWAENVVRHTNRPVLILTPLAVARQTVREAEKFGIGAVVSRDGKYPAGARIVVTNYEKLYLFSPEQFIGCVCDESSCLKDFDAARTAAITEFMRTLPYRLLCTATAAPNDYDELGTSAECLGEMGYQDMLSRFFKQQTSKDHLGWGRTKYRLRPHAEHDFWRWICSWARACRKPSDLGFDDGPFVLPELRTTEYVIEARTKRAGLLFDLPAISLNDQREERRRTLVERGEKVAELVGANDGCSICWVQLNDEGDLLEEIIPGSVQISGQDSDEWKELAIRWFIGEICICQLRSKSNLDKISICQLQNDLPVTGQGTTRNTGSRNSRKPPSTRRSTRRRGKPTIGPTISPTSTSTGDGHESSETPTTRPDGPDTSRMENIGRSTSRRPGNTRPTTPPYDSVSGCGHTGSRSRNTNDSSQIKGEHALSADGPGRGTGDSSDSSSTTVTRPVVSGDYSAPTATRDSGISRTTSNTSSVPPCTCGHITGKRVLISKPEIIGFGLNLQCCAHLTYFPAHSWERYYQSVRRCYRFGQDRPVQVDMVTSEGERGVIENLSRKSAQAEAMFERLVNLMNEHLRIERSNPFTAEAEVPPWLPR